MPCRTYPTFRYPVPQSRAPSAVVSVLRLIEENTLYLLQCALVWATVTQAQPSTTNVLQDIKIKSIKPRIFQLYFYVEGVLEWRGLAAEYQIWDGDANVPA